MIYKTLADSQTLAARAAAVDMPHVRPLNRIVRELKSTGRLVPWFDPSDGGIDARLMILLESPARRGTDPRFVSRDNPAPTQTNLRRFLGVAKIERSETILWNVVPWVLDPDAARNRAPKSVEITDGLNCLTTVLHQLDKLEIVVAAGRRAGRAKPVVARVKPDVAFVEMPHPSPVYVNTSPDIAVAIQCILSGVSNALEESVICR